MDISYQLANYLSTQGFGSVGTDIFLGQIPTDGQGIFIVRSGGSANNYLPIEEAVLDIYTKYTSSQEAITQLEAVKRTLHRKNNFTNGSAYVYTVLVTGDITDVLRDDRYDKIYKITVQVTHRDTGLIS